MMDKPTGKISPFLRLRESMAFFRVYGWELGRFFIILYLPVVLVSLLVPDSGSADNTGGGFPAVSFIFNFFYQPIYTGALIYQLTRIAAGQSWTMREGFITGVRLWDKLLLVNLVSLGLTLVGFMALIVPGLIAYARLALAEFRIVIDGDNPRDALKNSFIMTRPYTLAIITCTAVLFGVYLSLQLVIERLTAVLAMPMVFSAILNTLLSVVLLLFLTILLFRFYGLAGHSRLSPE